MSQREMFIPDAGERGRQASAILGHLRDGKGITSTEALDLYGISRLAAVVFDLRKAGHTIVTQRVSVPRTHGEGTASIGRYWLDDVPAGAGA